jgi:hypothetical protein
VALHSHPWTRGLRTGVAVLPMMLMAAVGTVLLTGTPTAEAVATRAPSSCEALLGLKIPAHAFSLRTRGGEVTAASSMITVVNGETVQYCQVDASIHPVDRSAPDIMMRVALPTTWNRRTMMFGGGGLNGTIPDVTAGVPFGRSDQPTPLARGFATFASDSGHQANPAFVPSTSLDGSFAANDEALENFATGAALKKTRDAAMFILGKAYADPPLFNYFAGGSTGGREALVVAQRWPKAFDGVISGYPAWNNMAEILYIGHLAQVFSRPGAFPNTAKQTLLYTSVIQACDGKDGVRDRVISDVAGCHFDPASLRCPRGIDAGPACLSDLQIEAVRTASRPWYWKYRLDSGERGYPGFPFLSGADMRTPLLGFGSSAPANPMPKDSGYGMQYWEQWVKYFLTRDAGYNSLDVDPANPGKWLSRIQRLSTVEDRNDADLRPFLRSGGKLLLMHGSADELVSQRSTSDYFRRVRHIVGNAQTRAFMRYYVVPGANHADFGAPAFSAQWDSVTAITNWVEKGRAPRDPVVKDGTTGRTRPMCEYPSWPKYVHGDADTASSFTCWH